MVSESSQADQHKVSNKEPKETYVDFSQEQEPGPGHNTKMYINTQAININMYIYQTL